MQYKELKEADIDQIWDIDRSEYIETIYVHRDGILEEKPVNKMMTGWPPNEEKIYSPLLHDCYRRGGFFWGGFENGKLKAVAVLESKWIGKNKDTLQLKFLHIDRAFRGKGIGRVLFKKMCEQARQRGAKRLYISSCENKNTVEFYKHLGCTVTNDIDPDLFALEPRDIHMEFTL